MTVDSNQINFNNSGGIVNRQTPKVTENGSGSNNSSSNNSSRNVVSNQVNINNSGGIINSGGAITGTAGTPDSRANHGVFIPSAQGEGAYIRAIAPGVVIDAGYHSGMGNHAVVIQYENGTHMMYGYNRIHYVSPGDTVNPGDVIAEVGCHGACAETASQTPGALIRAAGSFQGLTSGTGLLDPMQEMASLTNNNSNIAPGSKAVFKNVQQPNNVTQTQASATNAAISNLFDTFRVAVGGPYTWGNGHGDNMTPEDAYNFGADSTGIFNIVRRAIGLPEIGSLPEYYSFLTNKQTYNPGTPYPQGTILMNPGLDGEGHMAMIFTSDKNIAESYGEGGISIVRTAYDANKSFAGGFTIAGEMPDLGVITSTLSTGVGSTTQSATQPTPTQPDGQGGFTQQAASSSSFRAADTTGGGGSGTGSSDGSTDPSASGGNGKESDYNSGLDTVISYVKACVGAPYVSLEPDPLGESPEDVHVTGAMCSGLIDSALCYAGLGDLIPVYGSQQCGGPPMSGTVEWYDSLPAENTIDPNVEYPIGTIVVASPEEEPPEGHMAIVTGPNNELTQANAFWGEVEDFGTIQGDLATGDVFYSRWGTPAGTTTGGAGNRVGGAGGNSPGSKGAGDDEPCIMKNPLGVFRLQTIYGSDGLGSNQSLITYTAALNNGDPWNNPEINKIFCGLNSELGFGKTICGVTTDEGSRDWTQLGYSLHQPYKRTVDEVAASAMYDYCSIGTGEIVFWYPDMIIGMQDLLGSQDPTASMTPEARQRYLDTLGQQDYYNFFRGMSPDQITQIAPWLSQQEVVDIINYLRANPAPNENNLGSTDPLQQLSDPKNKHAGSGKNVDVLTAPIILKDTELMDFHLTVSDTELVTHLYVLGDFRAIGQVDPSMPLEILCQRWSTIFEHPFLNKRTEQWTFDPKAFAFKYGIRSMKVEKQAIKTPGLAQMWAENEFLKRWLNCYKIDIETAYLPMAYPGQRLIVESLGLVMIIFEAEHTFGSEWSTKLSCGFPLLLPNATATTPVPNLPFWALGTTNDANKFGPQLVNGKAIVPENPSMYNFANDPLKQGAPPGSQGPSFKDFRGRDGYKRAFQDYQKGINNDIQNAQNFYQRYRLNSNGAGG